MKRTYIPEYVLQNASQHPDKPAIVHHDVTLTWSELAGHMVATANALSPLLPQDSPAVVGVLLYNSWEFVVIYLAVMHLGHTLMPFDPTFKRLENTSIIEQIEPTLVITDTDLQENFDPSTPLKMVDELIKPTIDVPTTPVTTPSLRSAYKPEELVATILFTSGTTGKPKATPYTHANYVWNVQAVSDLWQWTPEDTILSSLPLSHWHGLAMALVGAIYHGNTLYIQTKFDARETLELLQGGSISLFMHVPIAYFKLVEFEDAAAYDISAVRLCISGSSYLPPAIWHAFKQKYGQEILERYGASEMGLLASNRLDERIPGSVGYVLPEVEVRVEPDGELAMRSPGLFPGYYRNPEATKDHQTKDGWWLSGDIGEFADNGRLVLKGRIQEKMKKHGYTVYPRDVEWAVLKNPAVHDIVVVGIQDTNNLSDQFVYFTVADASEAEITEYCKQNLPAAWRPDKVVLMPEIPKTRSGKPVLRALKEMLEK